VKVTTGVGFLFPLGHVLVAPDIANNLISISQPTKDGFTIVITERSCTATKLTTSGPVILTGYRDRGLLYICSILGKLAHEDSNSREITIQEHEDYCVDPRCYYMMSIVLHHLRAEPKDCNR